MPVSGELFRAINDEMQRIPIDDARWPELAVELKQLRTAAENALAVHDFDRDPTEFPALLRSRKG
jgi:hypothetical protein